MTWPRVVLNQLRELPEDEERSQLAWARLATRLEARSFNVAFDCDVTVT